VIETAVQKKVVQPMPFMTAAELRAIPPDSTRFILEGMLPGSGTSMLIASPKTGKSTFCHQLGISVAHGTSFLGRQTIQGDVLYITLEEKKTEFQLHLNELGFTDDTPLFMNFNVACDPQELITSLELAVEQRPNTRLIIIDPLFKFISIPDATDYSAIGRAVKPIHDLARRHKLHILMAHHSKKRKSDNVVDNALGSAALTGAVDSLLDLSRTKRERILQTEQRYGISLEPTVLGWDAETRSISIGQTVEELDSEKSESFLTTAERAIRRFVAEHPGCTQADIFEGVKGCRITTIKEAFKGIRSSLGEYGAGGKADPFRYSGTPIPLEENHVNEDQAEQVAL
jgi:hypothetical protein